MERQKLATRQEEERQRQRFQLEARETNGKSKVLAKNAEEAREVRKNGGKRSSRNEETECNTLKEGAGRGSRKEKVRTRYGHGLAGDKKEA